MKPTSYKNFGVIALFMILSLSLVLRLVDLDKRGLIEHDEGGFVLSSQLYSRAGIWFYKNIFELQQGKATFGDLRTYLISVGGGTQTMVAKPLHYLIIGVALWAGNFSDTPALMAQALFGVLTVFFLFLLGKEIYDARLGLIASLFLAVSAYHIYYSRSVYSQLESGFFLVLALLCYFKSTGSNPRPTLYLLLGALAVGLAITTHYNLIWEIPLVLAYEAMFQFTRHKLHVKRILYLCAGIIFPIAIFEIIFRLVAMTLAKFPQALVAGFRFRTYFEQISDQISAGTKYTNAPDLLYYSKVIWNWEGAITTLLISFGFILVLARIWKKRELGDTIIMTQFAIPLFLWSVSSLQYPRNLVATLPFGALIGAIGLVTCASFIPTSEKYRNAILLATLALIVTTGIPKVLSVVRGTSGYADAAEQLRRYAETHPGTIVAKNELGLSTDPIWRFYLGNLVDYDRTQGTVYIIDRSAYTSSGGNTRALLEQARCAQPIIQQPNDITWYMTGDSPTNPPEQVIQQIPGANQILMYDRRLASDCP